MNGALYYFYSSDNRYYFHAEENLNKVATDRADTLSDREVEESIVAQLQEMVGVGRRRRADVVICPESSDDVRDLDSSATGHPASQTNSCRPVPVTMTKPHRRHRTSY